jgi:hypothetical protein
MADERHMRIDGPTRPLVSLEGRASGWRGRPLISLGLRRTNREYRLGVPCGQKIVAAYEPVDGTTWQTQRSAQVGLRELLDLAIAAAVPRCGIEGRACDYAAS